MRLSNRVLICSSLIFGLGLTAGPVTAEVSCASYLGIPRATAQERITLTITNLQHEIAPLQEMINKQLFYEPNEPKESAKLVSLERYIAFLLAQMASDPNMDDVDKQLEKIKFALKLFADYQKSLRVKIAAINADIAALHGCEQDVMAGAQADSIQQTADALNYMVLDETKIEKLETWYRSEKQTITYETGDGTATTNWQEPGCTVTFDHDLAGVPGTLTKGDVVHLTLTSSASGSCKHVGGMSNGAEITWPTGFDWADPDNKVSKVRAGVPQTGKKVDPKKEVGRNNSVTVDLEVVSDEEAELRFYMHRGGGKVLVTTYHWKAAN